MPRGRVIVHERTLQGMQLVHKHMPPFCLGFFGDNELKRIPSCDIDLARKVHWMHSLRRYLS